MNKREFLKALEKRLKNLPKKEIQKSLAFYSEIIDDRMEEGDSEAEAVKNLGTPDEVAREILSDASFSAIGPRQRGAYQDEKRRQYAVRRAGSHRLSHLVSPARDGGRAPLFGCDRARRAVDSPLRRTRRAFILVVGGRRRGLRPLLYGRDGRRGSAFGVVRHGVRRNHAPRTARKKSAPLPVDDGGQMAEGHQKNVCQ